MVKEALASAPILTRTDLELPFCVQTDVSNSGIVGLIKQIQNVEEKVIAFPSRFLNKREQVYSSLERNFWLCF